MDIALRALGLARLRDPELEQELMRLYNSVLPPQQPMWQDSAKHTYFRAEPVPIATADPLGLNEKIPAAANRRRCFCRVHHRQPYRTAFLRKRPEK
jgi:hypothetical protein